MAIRKYFVFPKDPALLEPHHHSLGESCPSAEMPSVYSEAPANWAMLEESNPSVEMQSVYSEAPADWDTR